MNEARKTFFDHRVPTLTSVVNNTFQDEDCQIIRPGARLFDNIYKNNNYVT